MHVRQGTWNIGIVEDDIELSGEVGSTNTICTSTALAATVFDPTDSQLEGDWTCELWYVGAMFVSVVSSHHVQNTFDWPKDSATWFKMDKIRL